MVNWKRVHIVQPLESQGIQTGLTLRHRSGAIESSSTFRRQVRKKIDHRPNARSARQLAMHDEKQVERQDMLGAQQACEFSVAVRHLTG